MSILSIVIFWIIFWVLYYQIYPKIGLLKYRIKASYLDPKDGIGVHYKYDYLGMRFWWCFFIFAIAFVPFVCFPIVDILGYYKDEDFNAFIISAILPILIAAPAFTTLIEYKFNPSSGLYIYEDKIVTKGFLNNKTINKKDIQNIEYKGYLLGFEIKLKNGKIKRLLGVGLSNLPQQICTLLLYVSNNRKNIYNYYDSEFLAYMYLLRENNAKKKIGHLPRPILGLYKNKKHWQ